MANSYGEILTARGGSYILNDTNQYVGEVYAIVTLEDTKIDTIYNIDSNGIINDVTDDHIADADVIIKAGAIITPMDINKPFYQIQLGSGSVILVLK